MNILSNLIIPRVNLNSQDSINYALKLSSKYGFDSFILFSTDVVEFGKKEPFPISALENFKKEIKKNIQEYYFFIDAEKGLGHRCKEGYLLSDQYIRKDIKDLYSIYNKINKELKENNIFCNLAPVVDNNSNNLDILKNRVLGVDTSEIIEVADIFIQSCRENKIEPCLKHFPGHGCLNGDTHKDIFSSNLSLDELKKNHISIFINLLSKVKLIMTAHGWYKAFDTKKLPATLSNNILNKFLREKLNYKGLLMSDSMRMNSLTKNYDDIFITKSFFESGGDLLLDPVDPLKTLKILENLNFNNHEFYENKISKVLKFKKSRLS
tara:strand:- start:2494 stop:3462 length:969 start_codon:yes stop_codon:yes gene_type:complete